MSLPVAIIPARGGSRRIPRKNLRSLAGVPLVARAIDVLERSKSFEMTVVSTDDEAIAKVATDHGARILGLREPSLSGDHVPTLPVIQDSIHQIERLRNITVDAVVVAYPAAALATPADVVRGLELLSTSGTDAVISVGEFPHPVQRALEIDSYGFARFVSPEHFGSRTQDLPPRFFDAGQLYFGHRSYWMNRDTMPSVNLRLLQLPGWAAVDIDTEEDWARAEIAIRYRQAQGTQL